MAQRVKLRQPDYVVGFLFNDDMTKLALIRKNRPAWQAGRLNGHGGKIEPGEDIYTALMRETYEEFGVQVDIRDWHLFQIEKFRAGVKVYFFYACSTLAYTGAVSMTDEPVVKFSVDSVPWHEMISNLTYLIPMAVAKRLLISSDVLPLIPYVGEHHANDSIQDRHKHPGAARHPRKARR